ncbi:MULTISPECIES: DUF262 domain-containing protein [Cyanophyceae]|uniref:DUF262 domain-containing protein n=1 Tax=Cyanophyceae TaxID=3028117 RepID=UPI00168557F0|nr:DUF262 domain-containing protein [Trichocoleus sp. FACHB-69]MBD1930583.1 DUF262 domain-containing protein [Trichocoleus sp. FACHB-69]
MTQEQQTLLEDNLEDDSDEIIPFKYSINSYGADYPVDGLVKRLKNESIYIPSFQRGYVWKLNEASRFIESLLLGLPVPGIFLAKEQETQKLLVIDGQQRLRTLQYFYDGIFKPTEREFALKGVQQQFEGSTYKSLADEDRRRLDDSILHATIVKQDEPSDDDSSIYYIFERLNTGGTLLKPQEIRSCIYHGEFNALLHQLNENRFWRAIFGSVDKNMRDQELILRFLALYFNDQEYQLPMKGFLNKFMGKNQHLDTDLKEKFSQAFEKTIQVVYESIGEEAFKPVKRMNAAVFDAVMIGIARNLKQRSIKNYQSLKEKYKILLSNEGFISVSVKAANTSHERNVRQRIHLATEAFANVE